MSFIFPTGVNRNGNRKIIRGGKNMNTAQLLPLALAAVREASEVCEQISNDFRRDGDHHQKDDDSPVTIADYCSQALILHRLHAAAPEIGVVAEEQGGELRQRPDMCARVFSFAKCGLPGFSAGDLPGLLDLGNHSGGPGGRFWALDPIDGTKGYLRGGQYAVALALIEDGIPVLGVLGCPRFELEQGPPGALFFGGRDVPAAMIRPALSPSRQPIRVFAQVNRAGARLCESVESAHTAHDRSGDLIRALGLNPNALRMDSQAKYAAVALGQAALYMRLPVKKGYREKIWDHAAGVAVIEAAGGKVSDLNGKPLDFGRGETLSANRGVLASNGELHEAAVQELKTLIPPESRWV